MPLLSSEAEHIIKFAPECDDREPMELPRIEAADVSDTTHRRPPKEAIIFADENIQRDKEEMIEERRDCSAIVTELELPLKVHPKDTFNKDVTGVPKKPNIKQTPEIHQLYHSIVVRSIIDRNCYYGSMLFRYAPNNFSLRA